jgi:hypothetical protein
MQDMIYAFLAFSLLGFIIPGFIIMVISKNIGKITNKKYLLALIPIYFLSCLIIPVALLNQVFIFEIGGRSFMGLVGIMVLFQVVSMYGENLHRKYLYSWRKAE